MRGGASHIQEEMREVEEELEEDSSRHDTQNSRGNPIPLEQLEEGKFENGGSHSNSQHHQQTSSPTSARYTRSGSPRPSRGPSINFPLSQGGGVGPTSSRKDKKAWMEGVKEGARNGLMLMTNPVFAQAFILTFLGEWGDRSQITTIAMGGAHVSGLYYHSNLTPLSKSAILTRVQSIPVIAFGTIMGHGLCTFGAVMGGRYLSTKISVKHSMCSRLVHLSVIELADHPQSHRWVPLLS